MQLFCRLSATKMSLPPQNSWSILAKKHSTNRFKFMPLYLSHDIAT